MKQHALRLIDASRRLRRRVESLNPLKDTEAYEEAFRALAAVDGELRDLERDGIVSWAGGWRVT